MPDRYAPRHGDPVNRAVYGWDDGVEYISPESIDSARGSNSRRSRRDNVSPPPPYSSRDTRHKIAKYIPHSSPEEPESSHRRSRRRSLTRSPSPPRRRHTHRSPSPRRHERRPPLSTSNTTPNFTDPSDRPSRHRSHRHRPTPSPSPAPLPTRRKTEPPSRSAAKSKTSSPATPHSRSTTARSKTAKDFASLVSSPRIQQAAKAALQAGGATAFKLRKDPGSWVGPKGAKIATAALGAAAMDAFAAGGRDKGNKDGDRRDGGSPLPSGVGAVGGMLAGALADAVSKKGKK